MKIAIMSDSHDNWPVLEKAVEKANNMECSILLFAGDLISPPGIAILEKFNGEVKLVWGNNEGEKMGLTRKTDASEKIELFGDTYEGELEGLNVFMNHSPRITELVAKSGDFDLCVHGHFHDEARIEKVGKTTLINPGGLHLRPGDSPAIVVFDTKSRVAERVIL
ncbi:YfcE family phosphodiesterase [Candidatus Nomurabacteria bacterium]|uniref:Phosphoesterase n=1 Tax=candidate division WWE3 bacterium TaxID=2053526 RepID=A0A955E0X4_UNCKA|nr:YfcE family phosphodiesterase [candidate division WWE3 bacterium]MCB9824049.1 YfcE family phosphodiesterase [Candidatus Nomurabacteria bacterium]MCB9826980.1 YfcE family phosphodiesterase [Candidatus Nomurabacteria bacterium]MCB9827990.1 YfcE family phosphodiesterase [Candidatus Nomurabacteria bacterium]